MSSTMTTEQMASFSLWNGFTPEQLTRLLAVAEDEQFIEGQVLIAAGDHRPALWFLAEGQVQVVLKTPHGEQQPVADLGPGSLLGEVSFVRPAPHSASVICKSVVRAWRLDRHRFDELQQTDAGLAMQLLSRLAEILAARLQATDQLWQKTLDNDEDARVRERGWQMREAFYHFSDSTLKFMGPR